ncbi:MAG: ribonuclease H-like domain-containing protein [Lachnospiraceae bacterium]|nr:ribonuclease H-like domain-containing protein [Agathobacter sp.]MDD6445624.1 ribonuclease H-like domain-containing protein [Lachnospiraceae bacterium]MDY4892854.1 ribonuclease H-like domain-containing protein [Agathobacter sp.]
MKTIHQKQIYIRQDALTDQIFDEHSVFFDIETTGFSPANTSLYLIGCARRQGKQILIDQFFAENPKDEKTVLSAFLAIIKDYNTLISFNGVGFDIPYLKAKADHYNMEEHFRDFEYLDIFRSVSSIKFLLKLPNYKQKTVESFLGLPRDDTKTGGDLINVYLNYVKEPKEEAFDMLCLHNYEDVVRMIDLLPILSYLEILNGQYRILSTRIDTYHAFNGEVGNEMIITMQNDYPVPKRVSCKLDCFYLMIGKARTSLRIPVYEGELRYFYPNYKDYYYLKKEDMAVHKSVASYVDKEFREPAHATNCYTRKSGAFLPQYNSIMQPEFRREYKDKLSYFELTDDFSSSDIMLRRYIDHILKQMAGK